MKTLIIALALLASGCASIKKNAAEHQAARFPVIDAHTHTVFAGQKPVPLDIKPQTREKFLADLKEAGVVGAVAHTVMGEGGYDDLRDHNVIHCAGVGKKFDLGAIDAGLTSGKYGCIKIYLGYVARWAHDKAYLPLYKLAEKHDVPVVFHTGDTYAADAIVKYADPLTIDEVAVAHRKVRFVIAHCGNPWIQSAAEVAYKNPNVFLDGSAFMIGDLEGKTPENLERFVVGPLRWIFHYVDSPSKLMFGSDWPLANPKAYVEAFKQAIPREHWRKVFYENALKVFTRIKDVDAMDPWADGKRHRPRSHGKVFRGY